MPQEFADRALAEFAAASSAFGSSDVPAIRGAIAARAAGRPRGPEMYEVREVTLPTCPGRLYRPGPEPAPLVVYLHGGGWTVGSVASFDRPVRRLAAAAGADVLAVDYRLAPEAPWPASVDDTVATLRAVAACGPGATPGAVVVCGDSAGGTLATLACLRLRDEAPEALPDLQVLVYPNADLSDTTSASMREKATGYGFDAASATFFARLWVGGDGSLLRDPRVSPLHAPDLSGLPPAVVVTAEHDPIRDPAEAYARRLAAAGVPTTLRREAGMIHNFLQLDEVSPAAAAAADRVAADVAAVRSGTATG
ncbi:alpha/beta hydrolase [Pseudonocardia sp. DR1-2]|uniref:alpha/beta hydrolase n=1 Tax=Pseudonocardia sp. DR1-2 TaxID=2951168 RepID=UPI002042BFAF|nr:alpha/beta hydrolase [Pseudonocardia sp. DR1-2]MCM3846292.1 alpha/beta hydrolase [Pseudonocardia sp. DR1-2]